MCSHVMPEHVSTLGCDRHSAWQGTGLYLSVTGAQNVAAAGAEVTVTAVDRCCGL